MSATVHPENSTLFRALLFPWEIGICALVTAEASLLEQGEKQEKEAQLMS